uniref:Serine/threonine-protein kinase RIO1 n=1 Tax=Neobodo designis TaxID=312471 RepID=A0A7S1QUR5_NEODS|mmetsp:Transcript_5272/g.16731  ORF Transcript_5272/g.16731 Transcript_5272/m.16731 type:complete len:581 (+) Transcript_5272:23-1765(+)|eukprot:CAMPEP_0174828754 /NCGR_PEP_ID=MMETSP1114-20130205/1520_1 /TAXON_ID=312471 /ORGANISM="Neobodo designis, Strain CCAP 1951/1" /LENGTH=580 /DNA_ID=CAMNT_0016062479 /DNA_START=23 /DNA_END=1765 /DNA_ORIENTATION=-
MAGQDLKASLFGGFSRTANYEYDGNDTDDDVEDELASYEATRNGTVKRVDLASKPNTQAGQTTAKAQPSTMDSKVLRKIRVAGFDEEGGTGAAKANQKVLNELREAATISGTKTHKDVDQSERATVENVLDPRTRLILYKLVNGGTLEEINGCVSTGKEANVYHAVAGDGSKEDVAIKVFKTSILVFKDREQYVSGEFRFQRYCKSNPRKMVRTWAEKEARNLTRLAKCGVNAPRVRLLRQHIIIMDFIGSEGWPAPRLKDVRLSSLASMTRVYFEVAKIVRQMFLECKLVHGDLSEYNLLYHEGKVVVIDVAQSVEFDHPKSLEFLRRDIVNVNAFFKQKKVECLFRLSEFYDFVTTKDIADVDQFLDDHRRKCVERPDDVTDESYSVDEQVFLQINVPRRLDEVRESRHSTGHGETNRFVNDMLPSNAQAGVARAAAADEGDTEEDDDGDVNASAKPAVFQKPSATAAAAAAAAAAMVAKMRAMQSGGAPSPAAAKPAADDDGTASASASGSDNEDDDDAGEAGDDTTPKPGCVSIADMTKEERKEHRKAVKAAQAAKRQEKTPKHLKKRACKQHKKK